MSKYNPRTELERIINDWTFLDEYIIPDHIPIDQRRKFLDRVIVKRKEQIDKESEEKSTN
jgi:hypothetical protein